MDAEKLKQLMTPSIAIAPRKASRSFNAGTFTELAAQISRIPSRQHRSLIDLNALEADDEDEYIEIYNNGMDHDQDSESENPDSAQVLFDIGENDNNSQSETSGENFNESALSDSGLDSLFKEMRSD